MRGDFCCQFLSVNGRRQFFSIVLFGVFLVGCAQREAGVITAVPTPPPHIPVFTGGQPPNLFAELLGKSQAEVDAKIETAWQQLFYGNPETQAVYYPVGDDMAYVKDIGNDDIRSEGISYGMM
ncbi:MAG TPA: hypothetical protein PLK31_03905, partial [Chloroflexota bacterium]|nr:hypothetical protein [Chloroflexota bacterium]